MKSKILKMGFGFFLMCLFVACNDSGTGSDDLHVNPQEQPILKSQSEEESMKTTTNEEIPSSSSLEEKSAPIN